MSTKPWWQSKTFVTGVCIVAMSVVEAIVSGLTWRQCVGVAIGTAVAVFRAVATKKLTK